MLNLFCLAATETADQEITETTAISEVRVSETPAVIVEVRETEILEVLAIIDARTGTEGARAIARTEIGRVRATEIVGDQENVVHREIDVAPETAIVKTKNVEERGNGLVKCGTCSTELVIYAEIYFSLFMG